MTSHGQKRWHLVDNFGDILWTLLSTTKSVHEKSPFENVHEKSPILKHSVHEMSLSTKCLHPVPTVRIHAISKIERVFLETRMLLKKGYQPILYQPPRALCKVRWVLHELIYWCSQAVLFYWFQKEIGQKIPCILFVVCKQFIRNIKYIPPWIPMYVNFLIM